MVRPSFPNVFFRLPPATAALLLSAVFDLTNGHTLPRQTRVVAYRELDVIPFPPIPTDSPLSPLDLRRRQEENTICGYIGGNSDLPATCSLGSHCVLDAANSVVGCCPNGGTCTSGVYTGCVDRNSDPQTEINPYVYTCQGTNVCYMNNFAGGYFQYGCGTASALGTTVQTSANGATAALSIATTEVSLTETPSSLTAPTTIGSFASTETKSSKASSPSDTTSSTSTETSGTSASSSSSEKSSRTTSKTRSHSSTSATTTFGFATPTDTTPTSAPPGGSDSAKQSQTGAIIGGVVGGAAAAISLVALVFYCLRRRNRNQREGPGPAPTAPPAATEYISPMQSNGAAFAPLPVWHDEEGGSSSSPSPFNNTHPPPPEPYGPLESTTQSIRPVPSNVRSPPDSYGPDSNSADSALVAPVPASLGSSPHNYSQPMRYNPGYMPAQPKGNLTPVVEEDQSIEREDPPGPGREIDDFSQAYSSAGIGQLPSDDGEEDHTPLRNNSQSTNGNESIARRSGGHRPLWQQNRQQSRNLMWL
ncbi:hypothetical protein F4808DRAFT_174727 [Astrocystis sublimbata]|nr:hypothetical protein F4808DRAFT_174727 [Astrocystis sublimbata]